MKVSVVILLSLVAQLLPVYGQSSNSVTPSTPAAATPSDPKAVDSDYVIGGSDRLAITVWKDQTLSGDRLVRPDGKISMPLLGDIEAAGLKPKELAAQIAESLKKFMVDPEVTVTVTEVHRNFVYLLGEVGKRGPVEMTPGMTFLEALSSGGGLTDFAKKSKVYILRNVDGKQTRIPVDYKRALKGDEGFNLVLVPGDTIVAP